jgi:hypothetical protein
MIDFSKRGVGVAPMTKILTKLGSYNIDPNYSKTYEVSL